LGIFYDILEETKVEYPVSCFFLKWFLWVFVYVFLFTEKGSWLVLIFFLFLPSWLWAGFSHAGGRFLSSYHGEHPTVPCALLFALSPCPFVKKNTSHSQLKHSCMGQPFLRQAFSRRFITWSDL
jgi:hypothetical protein